MKDGYTSTKPPLKTTIKYFKSILPYPMRGKLIPPTPPLNVVLIEPEIPPNTGNIARLCIATGSILHIVGTPSFSFEEKEVKRAGLDYWDKLKLYFYDDLLCYREKHPLTRLLFFTTRTEKIYTSINFKPGDSLVFGKESVGLPEELIIKYKDNCYGIPVLDVRSLNLANAVAIVLYEALRQLKAF